jgi:hypothetical protein
VAVHIREATVGAVMSEGEFFVIEAEEVEHRRVDVVALGEALAVGWLEAPFIALPMGDAALDTAAGEPVGEDEGVAMSGAGAAASSLEQAPKVSANNAASKIERVI